MSEIGQIEDLIQNKKVRKAKIAIVRWLRTHASKENQLLAINWYRRLSLYSDGLRLVMRHNPFEPHCGSSLKISAADYLSHMGGVSYALQLVENIEPKTAEELEMLAGIYFSANQYAKALSLFESKMKLAKDSRSYNARLTRLSIADCLGRMGYTQEAIEIGKTLIKESSEKLFISICKQAIGEYLCCENKFDEALIWLVDSQKTFPGNAGTYDHALLYKWLGYVQLRLGKKQLGKKLINKSTKIIRSSGLGEHVWFENLELMKKAKCLATPLIQRLRYFPGNDWMALKYQSGPLDLRSRQNKIVVHFSSDECTLGGKSYLGIPLEIRLLGYLRIADDWGISFEKLKSILWPYEGRSYLHLENRLRQLFKLLKRKYNVICVVTKKTARLSRLDRKRVGVTVDFDPRPIKLKGKKEFTREFLSSVYNLKKAQAARWLKRLLDRGEVKRVGQGRSIKYQHVPSLGQRFTK